MSPEEFEKQLKQQPLRRAPEPWRAEILAAAKSAAAPDKPSGDSVSIWESVAGWFSAVAGLRPKTLAALAAAWMVIVALHLATRDEAGAGAQTLAKNSTAAQEVIAEVREQRLFYAQLMGESSAREAEPPKKFLNRPRSERRGPAVTA
jgi:hypothetical protein